MMTNAKTGAVKVSLGSYLIQIRYFGVYSLPLHES